uniref:Uncharacterized protein n=1 Tax=Anguilla anguilla TaxID=7936 RepID=A0A0E9XET8_ANGAN
MVQLDVICGRLLFLWRSSSGETGSVSDNELITAPVLITPVWQVPSDDDGDLSALEFLHGNLQRVRLSFQLHHNWGTHCYLQSAGPQDPGSLVFGHVGGGDSLLVGLLSFPCRQDLHILLVFVFHVFQVI